jgi:hypothetical protein
MLRASALLLPFLALAACAEEPVTPDAADADASLRVRRLQMARLDVTNGTENCGNLLDDDGDGDVDFEDADCGGALFDDEVMGTNIHPGDRGVLSLWDGDVRYAYTGATATAGGSLRLDRTLVDTRGRVLGTATTWVNLGAGQITALSPVLPQGRLSPSSTGIAVGTDGGHGWLVEDGFANDEIYED